MYVLWETRRWNVLCPDWMLCGPPLLPKNHEHRSCITAEVCMPRSESLLSKTALWFPGACPLSHWPTQNLVSVYDLTGFIVRGGSRNTSSKSNLKWVSRVQKQAGLPVRSCIRFGNIGVFVVLEVIWAQFFPLTICRRCRGNTICVSVWARCK